MATVDLSHHIPAVIDIAQHAGKLILNIYQSKQYEEYTKSDDTPVTSADIAAHQFIIERLSQLTPDIPILSEEDTDISFQKRSQWERYWLVDPLDGTQEFIARSDDFATIIALVEHNKPVMGIVYAPVSNTTYYAYADKGAWKIDNDNSAIAIHTQKVNPLDHAIALTISRRQNIHKITQRMSHKWHYDFVPLGSAALKACLVAEGGADGYLRIGPTGEWDTAATQCIVEQAGGRILSDQLTPLSYNERKSLENPNFIVLGNEALPWDEILGKYGPHTNA